MKLVEKQFQNIIILLQGVHWTKMNPTGAKLCERGKTHSIYINQSQRNCDEGSSAKSGSCELIWHYGCVDEKGDSDC